MVALQHKGRHTLDNSVLNASFAEAFGNLVKGAPLQCAHTDTQYEAGPVPKTVILDVSKSFICDGGPRPCE